MYAKLVLRGANQFSHINFFYRFNQCHTSRHFQQLPVSDNGPGDKDVIEYTVNAIIFGDQVPIYRECDKVRTKDGRMLLSLFDACHSCCTCDRTNEKPK